jgi:hypothetical protein
MEKLDTMFQDQCRVALRDFVKACINKNEHAQREHFSEFWEGLELAIGKSGELLDRAVRRDTASRSRSKMQ